MEDFNAHKWFKKQYLEEGMSDEEIQAIRRYEDLSADDKLKLAKIQKMMDKERELRDYYKGDSDVFPSSLKEDIDLLSPQFDDLMQVIRNIYHVGKDMGEFENIEEAAFEALQRIGEEFGINFEEGRF